MRKVTAVILVLCSLVFLSTCKTDDKPVQIADRLLGLEPKNVFSYFEQISIGVNILNSHTTEEIVSIVPRILIS